MELDEYGPPTQADEDWYWQHVGLPHAAGAPMARVAQRSEPEPENQTTIEDFIEDQGWWEGFDRGEHHTGQDS